MTYILLAVLIVNQDTQCNGRSDGGTRCWKVGGNAVSIVREFRSLRACREAEKILHSWNTVSEYQHKGVDEVYTACIRG